ncbi:MAG: hypothetical protein WCK57_07585 [Verrucomicrobiae bacterium]
MNAKLNFTPFCQRGNKKENGALFCQPCFEELPAMMQAEINVRIRDIMQTHAWAVGFLKTNAVPDDTHAAEYRAEDAAAKRRFADMRDGGVSKEGGQ